MLNERKARLVLDNGLIFEGKSFGYETAVAGEVVFSTAMVGYPESLTDPSYCGQILAITSPMVGNYGVPAHLIEDGLSKHYESEQIHATALIVSDYSHEYCHWNAAMSLGEWLKDNKVPAIYGIDTRELTKELRERGAMSGKIELADVNGVFGSIEFCDPNEENLVAKMSCTEVIHYGSGDIKVCLVDCGVKHNIIRCLVNRGVEVIRVPWNYDFNALEFDGLFISNGPGDPGKCGEAVDNIRAFMEKGKPIFGICMGNQLLSIAGGAKTYKLKYGHRSHNQPVRMAGTNRCFVTSQNHGYAVDNDTLSSDWEPLFINMNDETNEGIKHKSKPFFSCQFHPEAASGPTDTEFLFDDFIELIRVQKLK